MPNTVTLIIVAAVCAVVGIVLGFIFGTVHRRRVAEAAIGSAEKEANRIKSEALNKAEAMKKESRIEAKEEAQQIRAEADKEIRERRSEIQRQERRLQQKEENLDKKIDNLELKEEKIQKRAKEVEDKLVEIEQMKKSQFELLERISGYTVEQAKARLLQDLDGELTHEKSCSYQGNRKPDQRRSGQTCPSSYFSGNSALRRRPFQRGYRFGSIST